MASLVLTDSSQLTSDSQHLGMYKYIGTEETISALKHLSNELPVRSFAKLLRPDIKMRRIFRLCNPPEDIVLGSEGREGVELDMELRKYIWKEHT
uniref:(California timema) hypothetical protein n=1 Tax=Timema californicum TaxID=61474 RepID=A0A7R9JAN4_TIMCA|nr:unnamed protein product [Timema californicum]